MKRVFILDKSGSMYNTIEDTIGGYNAFIEDQKSLGGTVTLVTFNNTVDTVYTDVPIEQVEPLSRENYVPQGNTALYDAIGKVLTDGTEPDTVIIMTDGVENSSSKYTADSVRDLIRMYTEKGVLFMYLGAKHDAFYESDALGIHRANAMNYECQHTPNALTALSQCIRIRSAGDHDTPLEY